jgi:Tol biopolymer transport system component
MNPLRTRARRAALLTVLAALGAALAAPPLPAQYFGRNKVQYRTFDFQLLRTDHFDIYYYPEIEESAHDVGRMAERWYARLSRVLNHEFEQRQPIILYASPGDFQQTNVIGPVGEGTGGVTESAKQRIVMPVGITYAETDHVLGHELVHAFQYDISGLGRSRGAVGAGAMEVGTAPLWFIEGMAEYLSVGPVSPLTAMWLRDAALHGTLPSIERLSTDPRIFPYRYGHAVWAYVAGRWGDAVVGQILRLVGQGTPYPLAFERILNTPLPEISEGWMAAVRRTYLPLLAERTEASETASALITQRRHGGRLNLAPVLSPDGRHLAFLSERDMDVDLWLADAQTGEVIRRLQKGTAFDAHYSSLNFINSAGTFSPDGTRFAFAAQQRGRDVISIIDVRRARRLREIPVPGVGGISNPTWSPDGRTIYFSALQGGRSNLIALDVEGGTVRQLTDGPYADLQPAVSPDGRTVAFVSDRSGSADWDLLRYGPYQIHLLDVESGAIEVVAGLPGKNINPAWTRDSQSLLFVSDADGVSNIYRVSLESGEIFRITNLYGGVSGITDLSPTLTVSRADDRLVFGSYEAGGYNLYALNGATQLAGRVMDDAERAPADSVALAAVLPPSPRPAEVAYNRVARMLADDRTGLPAARAGEGVAAREYVPRLSLDYVGQPQVGYSTGSAFNRGGLYGGVAAIWSDMLGRHTVFGALSANGQLDEVGFAATYLYRRNRWNYGAGAQRIPYVYGYYTQGLDPSDGFYKRQWVRARIFDSSLRGLAQYPFSRVQRLEVGMGARRIAQDAQIYEQVYTTDSFVGEGQRTVKGVSYNLVESSVALIHDSSLQGYTSPFAGQRYRFELAPTIGDLHFVQALADYRRYQFWRPFTLAVRGLHFGRYGRDAEEDRLFPDIYLGYPSLMRGYYDAYADCQGFSATSRGCQVLSQLSGSRIGVVNAELRFPLLRYLVLGFADSSVPPIEGFAFFDAGVAWRQGTGVALERGVPLGADGALDPARRGILTSTGVGARVNLFGYFVFEIDYVNALERQRGWHWQFAIQPGF